MDTQFNIITAKQALIGCGITLSLLAGSIGDAYAMKGAKSSSSKSKKSHIVSKDEAQRIQADLEKKAARYKDLATHEKLTEKAKEEGEAGPTLKNLTELTNEIEKVKKNIELLKKEADSESPSPELTIDEVSAAPAVRRGINNLDGALREWLDYNGKYPEGSSSARWKEFMGSAAAIVREGTDKQIVFRIPFKNRWGRDTGQYNFDQERVQQETTGPLSTLFFVQHKIFPEWKHFGKMKKKSNQTRYADLESEKGRGIRDAWRKKAREDLACLTAFCEFAENQLKGPLAAAQKVESLKGWAKDPDKTPKTKDYINKSLDQLQDERDDRSSLASAFQQPSMIEIINRATGKEDEPKRNAQDQAFNENEDEGL